MFKVEAYVRPERLDAVKNALVAQGFDDYTVTEICNHGSHHGQISCYRGITYEIPDTHGVRIEIAVPDEALEAVVERIRNAAHTGQRGDGKILVTQLADAIEISVDRPVAISSVSQDYPTNRPRLASTVEASSAKLW